MKRIFRLWCWFIGHDMTMKTHLHRMDDGRYRSTGWKIECARCGVIGSTTKEPSK